MVVSDSRAPLALIRTCERPDRGEPEMLWHAVNDAQRLSPRDAAGIPAFGRPVESCGNTHYLKPGRWRR
jgi:hypothetical protein